MESLPYITADLPGIGGELRSESSHFVVEEIPLYEPVGKGEHVYLRLTREGWTTRALADRLMKLFGLSRVDVGYAGLKDKHARTTQVFSLRLPNLEEAEVESRVVESLPVEIEWVRRHRNKLKQGHLIGNRFRVLIVHPGPDAADRARSIADAIQERGLPNFYGEQRFGITGENAQLGREVLMGSGPKDRWTRRFLLAAFQADLFNTWLKERIRRSWFDRLLEGDIAKKVDTGGLFEVELLNAERPRFQRREITYTGPIYGWRMLWASGDPGELERRILTAAQVTTDMLRKVRLDGSRRPARVYVNDLRIEPRDDALVFLFSLPKAAYATTLLREFAKAQTRFGD